MPQIDVYRYPGENRWLRTMRYNANMLIDRPSVDRLVGLGSRAVDAARRTPNLIPDHSELITAGRRAVLWPMIGMARVQDLLSPNSADIVHEPPALPAQPSPALLPDQVGIVPQGRPTLSEATW